MNYPIARAREQFPLLRKKQIAERFGVCEDTIDRWVASGRFPRPLRIGPRAVAWTEDALNDYLAKLNSPRGEA